MAGRAGRRGLDNVGMVVINCGDTVPEESEVGMSEGPVGSKGGRLDSLEVLRSITVAVVGGHRPSRDLSKAMQRPASQLGVASNHTIR